jgi:NMD protein affecting ribosome stability and mRNA decay
MHVIYCQHRKIRHKGKHWVTLEVEANVVPLFFASFKAEEDELVKLYATQEEHLKAYRIVINKMKRRTCVEQMGVHRNIVLEHILYN